MRRPLLRSLLANDRGAAVIELALVAPILALTIVGIVDMSNAFSRKLALEQGAHRAIEKIMQTTEADTVEGTLKTEAVCQVNGVNATTGLCNTSPITAANVTVTWRLECYNSTSRLLTTQQTSTDAEAFDKMVCSTGEKDVRYIEVKVSDRYTPMFSRTFSALDADGTYHLTATAGMRTQ